MATRRLGRLRISPQAICVEAAAACRHAEAPPQSGHLAPLARSSPVSDSWPIIAGGGRNNERRGGRRRASDPSKLGWLLISSLCVAGALANSISCKAKLPGGEVQARFCHWPAAIPIRQLGRRTSRKCSNQFLFASCFSLSLDGALCHGLSGI